MNPNIRPDGSLSDGGYFNRTTFELSYGDDCHISKRSDLGDKIYESKCVVGGNLEPIS